MARDTKISLRNETIYSVYIRNHTKEGTFESIIPDLDRIKSVGADYIWFLPIHPSGVKNRKGDLGSPYAIQNYREVNPEFGTMADFKKLVKEIHNRDMKVMIDVVYNHTSPDSWLKENHPEYFFRKENGDFGNKTSDWGDVIDLDFRNDRGLWGYLIETLCFWAEIVDGFRCDVAPLIPLEFWEEARATVAKVNPNCIWLAESVEDVFIRDNRRRGLTALSDSEIFQAFDICYDYDVYYYFMDYMSGKIPLADYVKMLNYQSTMYPDNYVKLRFLENHDRPRAKSYILNDSDLLNWTAFMYFQKGTTLLYGGQETENTVRPDLFDYDKVEWDTGKDISGFLRKLYDIKKDSLYAKGDYWLETSDTSDTIITRYSFADQLSIGIFAVKSESGNIKVTGIPDGVYVNKLNGDKVEVKNERVFTTGDPIIFDIHE